MSNKTIAVSVFMMLALAASAAGQVELLSPTNGEIVAVVPDAQKKVIALPTLEDRIKLFVDDRTNGGKVIRHDGYWRKSRPFRLKWKVPSPGKWAAKVEIGKKPDLSDARVWYVGASKIDDASGREKADGGTGGVKAYTVPYANLEVAQRYFLRPCQLLCLHRRALRLHRLCGRHGADRRVERSHPGHRLQ